MSDLKIFSDSIQIDNKRVIVRLDLNVPIKNFKIEDDTRIRVVIPFLNKLLKKKAKVILITHLGRPKGKVVPELSLKPIFDYFKKNLKEKIYFYQNDLDNNAVKASNKLASGEVLLFENIRFFKEEENNEESFAKKLAGLGDIFINEAFSCSHRKQASIHKITKFINSYGGPTLEKETNSIDLILKNKRRPVTCIIGGSKVSTKINILSSLSKNADNIVIVGAMANNFLKFNGLNVGASLIEKNSENIVKDIIAMGEKNKCNIIIPVDCNTSKNVGGNSTYKSINDVGSEDIILDIGKKTIELISKTIDNSNTVFWNGPAGYFENKNFLKGTISIAENISKNTIDKSLVSVLGGGDTLAAINKSKNKLSFSHLSTAGGAFLEYLEGKDLPGLSVLK